MVMPMPDTMSVDEYNELVAGKRRSKYNNRHTVIDGIRFDSAKEARRYSELRLMEQAGEITDLQLQPRFLIEVNGVKVCTYVADFQYTDANGELVVEDVKGVRTSVYTVKAKLMRAVYGIVVQEV